MVELEKYIQAYPPTWKYDIVYFYYLVHYLTKRQIQQKGHEFFAINVQKLKAVTVWNIDKYINYLVKGEFLMRDYYVNGKKAYYYKLNPQLLQGHRSFEVLPGTRLHSNMVKNLRKERNHDNRLAPHLKQMQDYFMQLEMDYSEANKWIDTQTNDIKKFCYYTSLAMIQDKRFRYFRRNRTNYRLDSNLTSLLSGLKPFLIGDFVSIDLANSQPFFLCQLIGELLPLISNTGNNSITIPLCLSFFDLDVIQWFDLQQIKDLSKISQNWVDFENGELLNLHESVVNGSLYDDFQSTFDGETLSRDEVKEIIFPVLFSQNVIYKDYKQIVPYQKEKAQFASVYPTVYKMVRTLKQKDHRQLSVFLQRLEARVFIDTICPKLVHMGIIPLTIHDSIIVEAKHADRALQACQSVFKETFGVIPAFHVKSLKKELYER